MPDGVRTWSDNRHVPPDDIEELREFVEIRSSQYPSYARYSRIIPGCLTSNRWARWPVIAFIEVIRGTPLLIQLFIIFYGLPSLGIKFSPLWAAVIGLGINYAAYEAENYRAGIQSIPRGQLDAALALGLTRIQTIRKIVLPQAVRLVIPPVTNDFIALLKDSSLVSVITMVELTKMYGQLAATNYDYIGIGLLTAAIYFLLGLPIARLSRLLETRLAYMKI